jgi:hypothetical protein
MLTQHFNKGGVSGLDHAVMLIQSDIERDRHLCFTS